MSFNIKSKLLEYKRVLLITKKPKWDEFKTVVKVTAIGTALIGLIGFAIHMGAILVRSL